MYRVLAAPEFWKGFLGVLVAVAVAALTLGVWHLWSDHQALHVLIEYLNAHAAAINKLPR